jgi:nucleoid DNA-binding protein
MADCQLSREQATAVYEWFGTIAAKELGKKGSGAFLVPGVAKFTRAIRPATKAHAGRNPATGEAMTIAAKPAHPVVRASIVKALADLIESGK